MDFLERWFSFMIFCLMFFVVITLCTLLFYAVELIPAVGTALAWVLLFLGVTAFVAFIVE